MIRLGLKNNHHFHYQNKCNVEITNGYVITIRIYISKFEFLTLIDQNKFRIKLTIITYLYLKPTNNIVFGIKQSLKKLKNLHN